MERRFLAAIHDAEGRGGAFATRREGWVNPRRRASVDGAKGSRLNVTDAQSFRERCEHRVGVYTYLYHVGGDGLRLLRWGLEGVVDGDDEEVRRVRSVR